MNLKEMMAHKAASKAAPGWVVRTKLEKFVYPYQSIGKKTVHLTVAQAFSLANGTEVHNVVISVRQRESVDEKDYRIWCADAFLEGKLSGTSRKSSEVKDRCHQAAEGHPDAEDLATEMESMFSALGASDKCDFWKNYKKPVPELCEHTQTVLVEHVTEQLLVELAEALDERLGKTKAAKSATKASGSVLTQLLFRVPVLIEGDRGSGKTFEARAAAREGGYPLIEVPGHEGVEAVDLLGHYVPMPDRSLVWKDGGLTRAFRLAAAGQKVLLLLDELLRIAQRQQSVILTAFSEFEGHYSLRTGRIVNVTEGVGEEEVIRCPVKNLAVVATTNVGAEYAVDQIDPAVAERWVILRKDTTPESLKQILTPIVAGKGFSAKLTDKLVTFFTLALDSKRGGMVARTPTTRTLVRAVELAASETDVPAMLLMQYLLWVGRNLDGFPITEQQEALKKIASRVFPGASL